MQKILFTGFATLDLIDGKHYFGGAAGGMSLNATQLGITSFLLAPISQDRYGNQYTTLLKKVGVDTTLCDNGSPSIPTCVITDVHGAGSTRVWKDNGALAFTETMSLPTPEILSSFDAVVGCNAPYRLVRRLLPLLTTRSFYYIPGPACVSHPENIFIPAYEKTEIVFGNEEESPSIFSSHPFDFGVELVVITKGKSGCDVYTSPTASRHFSAPSIKAIDTTGAGDCFTLGFIHAWLENKNVDDACAAGFSLATHIIQRKGVLLFDPQ